MNITTHITPTKRPQQISSRESTVDIVPTNNFIWLEINNKNYSIKIPLHPQRALDFVSVLEQAVQKINQTEAYEEQLDLLVD